VIRTRGDEVANVNEPVPLIVTVLDVVVIDGALTMNEPD
jgi:hypothetical protein